MEYLLPHIDIIGFAKAAARAAPCRAIGIFRRYDACLKFGKQARGHNMLRSDTISWRHYALIGVVGAAAVLWSRPGLTAGAIAIGIPPGGIAKGFAGGHTLGATDMPTAREGAVGSCHKSTGASDAARNACAVVASFKDECYAIALDPKDGTPGAGWAVAETQALADEEALQQCRNTSAADRKKFCEVPSTNHGCDGTAK
jgi:hypothetical protein